MEHRATYSPEDNKLRLYPAHRLDPEEYNRVKAAGFKWAPKQELFVAPMWTPSREDLLLEMCGDIEDEDSTIMDRAEAKAERLEDLSDRKSDEADRAHAAVSAIADNIPFGQPILVGHHSERRARKDAEKIQNGVRRAVNCWKAAEYWKDRAQGAIRHAKYKERPDVRARRIKGIEADRRKMEREQAEAQKWLNAWAKCEAIEDAEKQLTTARTVAGCCHLYMPKKEGDRGDYPTAYDALKEKPEGYDYYAPRTLAEVFEHARKSYPRTIADRQRWIDHYDNRLAYERAMLADAGGIATDRKPLEVGGAVRVPLWSPGHGQGWAYIRKVNKVTVTIQHKWDSSGRPHDHKEPFDGIREIMTRAEVETAKAEGRTQESACGCGFYLMQSREEWEKTNPPKPEPEPKQTDERTATFEAMQQTLKAGVQVVSAPQLFPTPPELAARMVELAGLREGERVLEPSAGTGNLLRAIFSDDANVTVCAVEHNGELIRRLSDPNAIFHHATRVVEADFLGCNPFDVGLETLGKFDAVLMNPPFENAADIKHIQHALTFLKPGGRLVAICANGPRQNEQLKPMVESYGGSWEELPAGTFKQSGTNISTVLLSLTIPHEATDQPGAQAAAMHEETGIDYARCLSMCNCD